MMFDDMLASLIVLEKKIENAYLDLVSIEIIGSDSSEYQKYFELIRENTYAELKLMEQIYNAGYFNLLQKKIYKMLSDTHEFDITLGRHTMAIFFRLKYNLESISYEDNLVYINQIRTDCNKIILSMLDIMLNDPYFAKIRDELIWYKYNLYFLFPFTESDFLANSEDGPVLESNGYRSDDFLSTYYLDQAVLVLPSVNALNYVIDASFEDFLSNKQEFTAVTIKLLKVISNMTLCSEENIGMVLKTINDILSSPDYSPELKEVLGEVLNILQEIKAKISYKR